MVEASDVLHTRRIHVTVRDTIYQIYWNECRLYNFRTSNCKTTQNVHYESCKGSSQLLFGYINVFCHQRYLNQAEVYCTYTWAMCTFFSLAGHLLLAVQECCERYYRLHCQANTEKRRPLMRAHSSGRVMSFVTESVLT
jgi:hypothetical protein